MKWSVLRGLDAIDLANTIATSSTTKMRRNTGAAVYYSCMIILDQHSESLIVHGSEY